MNKQWTEEQIKNQGNLEYPFDEIIGWIRDLNPNPKNVIDLGAGINLPFQSIEKLGIIYKSTTAGLIPEQCNYKNLDFNKQKLPFKNEEFDLSICTFTLEHLFEPYKFIEEIKRVTKHYILIALPNQYTLDERIKFLFGRTLQGFSDGYDYHAHHTMWNIDSINKFYESLNIKIIRKEYYGMFSGARFLPHFIQKKLAETIPRLFAKQVWCLFKKLNRKEEEQETLIKINQMRQHLQGI